MLQRLLLLPLLAPLLAVLLVGALNPRPWVALQLLVWRTPAWPLGAWIGLAAAGGGALSAGATALALRSGGGQSGPARRRPVGEVFGRRREAEVWPEHDVPGPAGPSGWGASDPAPGGWAGPSRAPGDPPPTVSVPFRILRRGSTGSARPNGPASSAAASATGPGERSTPAGATVVGTGDGWDEPGSDDW